MIRKVAACLVAAGMLSSCVTTPSQSTVEKAQKTYDTICGVEPAVYGAFVVIANKTKIKESIKVAAADAHVVITHTCASRPTDIITAAATLLSAYNEIQTASSGQ